MELIVDPAVTRDKLDRDVEQWRRHAPHRERGWVLLDYAPATHTVDIAFLARVGLTSSSTFLPAAVCTIRLVYDNYDLLPPSLTFIDLYTRAPAPPHVRAILQTEQEARDVLINSHPDTGLPFLCLPGIREYHSHPQHSGDSWLLHRASGEGNVTTVCERVWRHMVRNVIGLNVALQAFPTQPLQAQVQLRLAQGEIEITKTPMPTREPIATESDQRASVQDTEVASQDVVKALDL